MKITQISQIIGQACRSIISWFCNWPCICNWPNEEFWNTLYLLLLIFATQWGILHDKASHNQSMMKSVTVNVTVSAQCSERPRGRWPHHELIPQMCAIKEGSVFPEGRKVKRTLDGSERVGKWMYVCFGRRWLTYTGVFPSLRWGESDCWLTRISPFFLFMGRLASDGGVLGDWCQWRWLQLLGLRQMV